MQLTELDEGLHPCGTEENWQESWALGWRDAAVDVGGNHRCGNWENRRDANLWCAVFHARDTVYRLNLENQPLARMTGVHGIATGPQALFHDGDRLRLTLDTSECTVDLTLEDFKDSVEAFEDGGGMSTPVYKSHFNMHFACHGTVRLGDREHRISDGLGWRDHSWGPRTYDTKPGHRSFHGNFGPDLNFHLLAMLTADGRIERRGHLVRNGKVYSFDSFTTRVTILEDGITPVSARCHVILPDGERLTFSTTVQKGVVAQVQSLEGFFGVGDCVLEAADGTRREGGFCNFEMTNNPRLGTRPLGLALGNTVRNGMLHVDAPPWTYVPL